MTEIQDCEGPLRLGSHGLIASLCPGIPRHGQATEWAQALLPKFQIKGLSDRAQPQQ